MSSSLLLVQGQRVISLGIARDRTRTLRAGKRSNAGGRRWQRPGRYTEQVRGDHELCAMTLAQSSVHSKPSSTQDESSSRQDSQSSTCCSKSSFSALSEQSDVQPSVSKSSPPRQDSYF